ncbi:PD-(D/E)XK nuclease family protein [Candidatus Latescibacterota bacterium]
MSRSYLLDQLCAVCAAHPVRAKILFAPSLQVGHNLTSALALSGVGWANLRVTTPVHHAAQQMAPCLAAEGGRRLVPGADVLLLEELLAQEGFGEEGYVDDIEAAGLARSLSQTLSSLRMAGVSPEQVGGKAASTSAAAVARVYAAYLERLDQQRLWDDAQVLAGALARSLPGRDANQPRYLILDETPLPELCYRYVRALGPGLRRLGRRDYGVPPPAHSAAARLADVALVRPLADASPPARRDPTKGRSVVQGDLFLDGALDAATAGAPAPSLYGGSPEGVHPAGRQLSSGLEPGHHQHLRLRRAIGVENEVRGLLRELLNEGVALDQVELAYTDPLPYLSLIVDTVDGLELPAAFAAGIPAGLTRPGQALSFYYQWMAAGLDAGELAEACRAGILRFDGVAGVDPVPPHRLASLLRQARAGSGREAYDAAFERLREQPSPPDEGAGDGPSSTLLERAEAGVRALLACVPKAGHGLTLAALTAASVDFLNTFAPVRGERDRRAHESLVDRLGQLGRTLEVRGQAPALARRLLELVEAHTADASVARPGSLYVVPLERAGYSGRPWLCVVGLDESRFPGGGSEDPLLLDDDRAALSPALPLRRQRPGERVWHYLRAAGRCPDQVVVVAGILGLADGREPYPSPLFEHAREQLAVVETPVYRPVPAPGEGLDEVEVALAHRQLAGYGEGVWQRFPWTAHGERAHQARQQDALTRFDGWVGDGHRELAVDAAGAIMSAGRLETLARCPYSYFLRHVLHARPLDEAVGDAGRWLSPQERGELLHQVYHEFMVRLAATGDRPDPERHAPAMEECVTTAVAAFRQRVPPLHEAALRSEVRGLERAAGIFLRAEAEHLQRRTDLRPCAFELDFGMGEGGASAAPVTVRLSERVSFRLRGRIDRVDAVDEGAYEIWDYKSGSTYGYQADDLLAGGTVLQWALYAHALPHLLPGTVTGAGYFFAGERGRGERIWASPPSPEELSRILEPLLDLVAAGAFLHVRKSGDPCRFCDYRRVCASESLSATRAGDSIAASEHLRVFADQTQRLSVRQAQAQSRAAMDEFLAASGVAAADLVPAAAMAALRRWLDAGAEG